MSYFNKTSKEVNKVYKTSELEVFKPIKGNRPTNPMHIKRLAASIIQNGLLQNPIIVNEKMGVIDGQHRLDAAKLSNSNIYYIIVKGYDLKEVQTLNINQKNWTKKDFMDGYAAMGIKPYIKLKDFINYNKVFNITDCISLCSNVISSSVYDKSQDNRIKNLEKSKRKEIFEEGTWVGRNFNLAQENADKLKMIKPYYDGYKRSTFIGTMLGLFKNEKFDFFEFLDKLKYQKQRMEDCTTVAQYKLLIEDIYNYRRREKVNLRY